MATSVKLFRQTYVRHSLTVQHTKPLSCFVSFLREYESANKSLTTLDLSIYEVVLGYDGIVSIAEALKMVNTVERVILTGQLITDRGFRAITSALVEGGNPVQVLVVDNCQLTERSGQAVSRFLTRCPTLLLLSASHNNIGKGVAQLLQGVGNAVSLEVLRLAQCGLTPDIWSVMPHVLPYTRTLLELDLGGNDIGVPAPLWAEFVGFARALAENTSLHTILLHTNSLPHKAAGVLHDALHSNTSLERIDVRYNKFSNQAMAALDGLCRRNVAAESQPQPQPPAQSAPETPAQQPDTLPATSTSSLDEGRPSPRGMAKEPDLDVTFLARMDSYRGLIIKADRLVTGQHPSWAGALPALFRQAQQDIMGLMDLARGSHVAYTDAETEAALAATQLDGLGATVRAQQDTIEHLKADKAAADAARAEAEARAARAVAEKEAAGRALALATEEISGLRKSAAFVESLREVADTDHQALADAALEQGRRIDALEGDLRRAAEDRAAAEEQWAADRGDLLKLKDAALSSNKSLVAQLANAHHVIATRDTTVGQLEDRLHTIDRDLAARSDALTAAETKLLTAENELSVMARHPLVVRTRSPPTHPATPTMAGAGTPLDIDLEEGDDDM